MSNALLCDKCGNLFPEGQEGSGRFTGTVNVKDPRGKSGTETRVLDQCAECNAMVATATTTRAIGGSVDG